MIPLPGESEGRGAPQSFSFLQPAFFLVVFCRAGMQRQSEPLTSLLGHEGFPERAGDHDVVALFAHGLDHLVGDDWGSDQFGTCRQFGKWVDWPCVTGCYEKF